MFEIIKKEKTTKFLELKLWVSEVQKMQEDDFCVSCKGLFFVYAYGIFERIITFLVQESIEELNLIGININECSFDLINMDLDPEYKAIKDVSRDKKWQKRWDIAAKFKRNEVVNIPRGVLPTDGKNISKPQLESLINTFGIKANPFPRPEVQGYVDQVARNRNAIAHGDNTPKEIGRNYTLQDIDKAFLAISDQCDYFITIFELYFINKEYLR